MQNVFDKGTTISFTVCLSALLNNPKILDKDVTFTASKSNCTDLMFLIVL